MLDQDDLAEMRWEDDGGPPAKESKVEELPTVVQRDVQVRHPEPQVPHILPVLSGIEGALPR